MKAIWIPGLLVALASAALAVRHVQAASVHDLRSMEASYWHAWEQGPDAAAPLYAKDADLVFYDLEPVKYVGWNAYKAGVVPNILSKFDRVAFTVNDDVNATVHGDFAWTSATINADGTLRGGHVVHVVIRHTAVWQKREGSWLIVHDHASVPSSLPAPPAK